MGGGDIYGSDIYGHYLAHAKNVADEVINEINVSLRWHNRVYGYMFTEYRLFYYVLPDEMITISDDAWGTYGGHWPTTVSLDIKIS